MRSLALTLWYGEMTLRPVYITWPWRQTFPIPDPNLLTNSTTMLKVFIVQNVPFHKAKYYAAYNAALFVWVCVCLCVCVRLIGWTSWQNVTIKERHTFEDHLNVISDSSLMNYKIMAETRICETLAIEASPNLGINTNDYGPWNSMRCVQ